MEVKKYKFKCLYCEYEYELIFGFSLNDYLCYCKEKFNISSNKIEAIITFKNNKKIRISEVKWSD